MAQKKKSLKSCPKSNKSPNLVTLDMRLEQLMVIFFVNCDKIGQWLWHPRHRGRFLHLKTWVRTNSLTFLRTIE